MTNTCFHCMETVPTGYHSFSSHALRKTYAFIPKLMCLEANRYTLFIASHGLNQIL